MNTIDFTKGNGLVPAIVQDAVTGKVLMLAYMNEEAVEQTRTNGRVTFYSRSKQRLWTKGEESGNYLELVSMAADCDQDALLVKVMPAGPVCHTGTDTCWGETNNRSTSGFVYELEAVLRSRLAGPATDSYTKKLHKKGVPKIAQKVGEEATEVVIEAMKKGKNKLVEESADLMYHYLLLLIARGKSFADVEEELRRRHR